MWEAEVPEGAAPLGYRFLLEHFGLETLPHHRWSYAGPRWETRQVRFENADLELFFYPKSYVIEADPLKHLEFALKHEGLSAHILIGTFKALGPEVVTGYVQASPTGKYARKAWFLYEYLMQEQLPIKDVQRGSYVPLLDEKIYYCGPERRSQRHRILDNFLGNRVFCPLVRRSHKLQQFEGMRLDQFVYGLTKQYDDNVLARATRYLYTKETIASWEIERERPSKARLARFVALLERDHTHAEINKKMLVSMQKEVLDPRFQLDGYRDFQNYVGEEPLPGEVYVHFISPKPEDLEALMDGLIHCTRGLFASDVHPVVVASILAFGFVYLHPFEDGNGRLHRFLIHYALSRLGFAPPRVVFPVSAVMLREQKEYDRALESFSRPLMELITDYELSELGELKVHQESRDYYSFIDFTPITEFLFCCVKRTIDVDFASELSFLSQYDRIRSEMKEVVDMPDRKIDLFIKCVRQNHGRLSERKTASHFGMLTEKEIRNLEAIIVEALEP
jgi:hypothetical protein